MCLGHGRGTTQRWRRRRGRPTAKNDDGDDSVAGVRNLTPGRGGRTGPPARRARTTSRLDLTDGAGGPGREARSGPTTEVAFTCTETGRRTFIEVGRATGCRSATLNGVAARHRPAGPRRTGLILPGLAAENILVVDADCAYSTTGQGLHRTRRPGRQGGLPLQPVRDRRRAARVRVLRPARPEGRLHLARHRAGALEGISNCRSSGASRPTRRPRPCTSPSRRG